MEETDRFDCEGDDGQTYTVIELTRMIETRPLSGPAHRLPGMKTLMLLGGGYVNFRGDDKYQVVQTDVNLRRIRQPA